MRAALERLRATDRALERDATLHSLCPGRERATPLAALGEALLPANADPALARAFAEGLAQIAEAIQRNFPGNLFWDLDHLAHALLVESGTSGEEPALSLRRLAQAIAALQDLFSHRSHIQFRYAHDFLYGFDWAKWVRREPETRAGSGPFALPFVHAMQQRGGELLQLIAHDDEKYPDIHPGQDRNPFSFSREPAAEEVLHRDLAERGLLPLSAWQFDEAPVWDRPYAALRDERARELGLLDVEPLSTMRK